MANVKESRKRKSTDANHEICPNEDTCNRGIVGTSKVIRRYQDSYLTYGFTCVEKQGIPQPLCVICGDILANEAMVPSKMKRHLHTKHKTHIGKNEKYFKRLLEGHQKQAHLFTKHLSITDKAQLASFQVAELVAKRMKPHTIVESLIMPACRVMVKTMLGEDAAKVICKMPSSNNTVTRRIVMMSDDISSSVCNLLQTCKRFALQIDESTDVSGKAQLMAFVRFSNGIKMLEQFLFCSELIETKGEDIFKCVTEFFVQHGLLWEWCVAVCTDGAPSMTGNLRGFAGRVKRENPNIVTTHCFIHREALVSKTMGTDLQSVLDDVIKMVNFIKVRPVKCRVFEMLCKDMGADHYTLLMHTEVRWLSKGKVLSRVYELRDELCVFFVNQHVKQNFVQLLSDSTWCSKLAYLVDIFEVLNALNSSMQGNESNILSVTDKLCGFLQKLQMWSHEIEATNSVAMFRRASEVDPGAVVLHDIIIEHLSQLDDKMKLYFPNLTLSDKDWIRNPFHLQVDMSGLQLLEKEQLIDVAADSTLRLKFLEMNLVEFWIMVEKEYTLIGSKAVGILLPFSTTYLCEKAFSSMTMIKTKHRGCLQALENDLRVCLSTDVNAHIETLSWSLQSQPSH